MSNIALIFPGQGAQFVGMGREFYEASPQAKAIFDQADTVIDGLTDVIFNGPADKLTSTKYCQPAIFTFSIAAYEAIKDQLKLKNLEPQFAAGLSLGELSALCSSGALSFTETLRLVERRSSFMEDATKAQKGAMAAVIGFEKEKLVQICLECQAEVANFNSPDQIVITGDAQAVEDASKLIKDHGAKRVIPLDVSGAFHSSLMKPAAVKFKEEVAKAHIQKPLFPILSNVDALPENNPEYIKRNLTSQITSSVQWVDIINRIAKEGITTFLEIGPGTVLKGLIRKINPELIVINIQTPEDVKKIF